MRVANVLLRHELRLFGSLALWVGRRRHGVGAGRGFGYARGQGAVMFGFAFVCVVETFTMSVLLREWPAAHMAMLLLDLYTVLFVVGLYAAWVVRPHVLDDGVLRIRHGVHVDVRVPLGHVVSVRRELRLSHERTDGELDVAIGSQTSLALELAEPVTHVTFLGRRREVSLVRFHADDPDDLVRALDQALTRVRSGPSPWSGLSGRRG
ncbi:hypothetical protein [Streptomyces griseus]|uniref:hypothetical protein n=1 Tax=Streptomyces griseus TaxID=1911 RepID=UPI00056B47A4|nr:hypothetical protein [Streptomyces griseus]